MCFVTIEDIGKTWLYDPIMFWVRIPTLPKRQRPKRTPDSLVGFREESLRAKFGVRTQGV